MPEIQGTEVGPDLYWPLVTITLKVEGFPADTPAIVDSGADTTIIPGEMLEGHPTVDYASLPVSSDKAGGAGGSFETRSCPGTATWRKVDFCTDLTVAEPGALMYPLLGRDDFFRAFIVKFNWNRTPPSMRIEQVKGKKF